MYPDWAGILALVLLICWLVFLSFVIWRQNNFLKSLFPKSGTRDIRKKFEEVLQSVEEIEGKTTDLAGKIEEVKKAGIRHIQKVEMLRFNPFGDTGGDQSFTACLLDEQGNGIVITSMHARSGTRIFGKEIKLGKSSKYELSKEEEQVIRKAMSRDKVYE